MQFLFLFALPTALRAQDLSPASTPAPPPAGFDSFRPGNLHGQHGWSVLRGRAEILEGIGPERSRALRIAPSSPAGQVRLALEPGHDLALSPLLYTRFLVRPVASPPSNSTASPFADSSGALSGFFRIDEHGEFFVLDADAQGGGEWLATGSSLPVDEEGVPADGWLDVGLRIDRSAGTYSVYLEGRLALAALGLWNAPTLADPDSDALPAPTFLLEGHTRAPVLFAEFFLSGANLFDEDSDNDGLPDAWEREAGLGLAATRLADPDRDGLSNLEELLAGTAPVLADTDGDGLSDAAEIAAGSDPAARSAPAPREKILSGFQFYAFNWGCASDPSTGIFTLWAEFQGQRTENWEWYAWLHDSETGSISPSSGSGSDSITLSTTDGGTLEIWGFSSDNGEIDVLSIPLCSACDQCSSGTDCISTTLGSVRFEMRVGQSAFGELSPLLVLNAEDITDALYQRSALDVVAPEVHDGRLVLQRDPADPANPTSDRRPIRRILTERFLTVLEDEPHGFLIRQYPGSAATRVLGGGGGPREVRPFRVVRFENPDPEGALPYRALRISDVEGGRGAVREYRVSDGPDGRQTWDLFEGAAADFDTRPLRHTRLEIFPAGADGSWTERQTIRGWNQASARVELESVVDTYHQRFDFGSAPVAQVRDPDGQALTRRWGYYSLAESGGTRNAPTLRAGRLKWKCDPDGSWQAFSYDQAGRVVETLSGLRDTPMPDWNAKIFGVQDNDKKKARLSSPADRTWGAGYRVERYEYDGPDLLLRKHSVFEDGVLRSADCLLGQRPQAGRERSLRLVRLADPLAGDIAAPENRVLERHFDARGLLLREVRPTGLSTVVLQRSTVGDRRTTVTFRGHEPSGQGERITEVRHRSGERIEHKVESLPSGAITAHWSIDPATGLDPHFRPLIRLDHVRNEITTMGYDCCNLAWTTTGDGLTTVTERDVLARQTATRTGYKDHPLQPGNVIDRPRESTLYKLDALGRPVESVRLPADPDSAPDSDIEPLVTRTQYALSGDTLSQSSPGSGPTRRRTLRLPEGGRIELTIYPKSGVDNRHRILSRHYHADGSLHRRRTYASQEPEALEPDSGALLEDLLYRSGNDAGRFYTETISAGAHLFERRVTRTWLNALGDTTETVRAFGTDLAASTRYLHDHAGRLLLQRDPDGAVVRHAYDPLGQREVSALDMHLQEDETPDHIDWETDRITRTTTRLVEHEGETVRQTRSEIFTDDGPTSVSLTRTSLDGRRRTTVRGRQVSTSQRLEGDTPGSWSERTVAPDGTGTLRSYQNGRLVRQARLDRNGSEVSWSEVHHDAFGRVVRTIDSRTGPRESRYDGQGRLLALILPNPRTGSLELDPLVTRHEYDQLGQLIVLTRPDGSQTRREYNALGTLRRISGAATEEVLYQYDSHGGQRVSMTTFHGAERKPQTTRWKYDALGRLRHKEDAAGQRVRYTWTPAGRLAARTWARGVTTRYRYHPGNHTDLVGIDYSDGTPDVIHRHTRDGRPHTVVDGVAVHEFRYHSDQPATLESEWIRPLEGQAPLHGETKVLRYDRHPDHGRLRGLRLGAGEDPWAPAASADYREYYRHDEAGRLAQIGSRGHLFTYEYLPHSRAGLIAAIEAFGSARVEREYEPYRDHIRAVNNHVGYPGLDSRLVSRYEYAHDQVGRRIMRTMSGERYHRAREDESAHPRDADGGDTPLHDRFRYDPDTGGVISAQRHTGAPGNPRSRAVPEAEYAYAYDGIGNRLFSYEGDRADLRWYRPDRLNQYDWTLAWNRVRTRVHDADGNLIHDGRRRYVWNAENRLSEIREGPRLVARYEYDYLGRRVLRETPDEEVRYLYHGWNVLAEYEPGERVPRRTYTWGPDLSGRAQGAGGVGGLLCSWDHDPNTGSPTTAAPAEARGRFYYYDGNGNVTETLDLATGEIDAKYAYDPFGRVVSAEGPAARENRWRFSTKHQDPETGWNYYGYRYYDPNHGRWINRDPIGEEGGVNLYGFLGNDGVGRVDMLGREPTCATSSDEGNYRVGGFSLVTEFLSKNRIEIKDPRSEIQDYLEAKAESAAKSDPTGGDGIGDLIENIDIDELKAVAKKLRDAAKATSRFAALFGLVITETVSRGGFIVMEIEMDIEASVCRCIEDDGATTMRWENIVATGYRQNINLSMLDALDVTKLPDEYLFVMIAAADDLVNKIYNP